MTIGYASRMADVRILTGSIIGRELKFCNSCAIPWESIYDEARGFCTISKS